MPLGCLCRLELAVAQDPDVPSGRQKSGRNEVADLLGWDGLSSRGLAAGVLADVLLELLAGWG
jgi:hypothetical protein